MIDCRWSGEKRKMEVLKERTCKVVQNGEHTCVVLLALSIHEPSHAGSRKSLSDPQYHSCV
jgi:hypothetical protein